MDRTAAEIRKALQQHDIQAGELFPATKNIYLNKNFTDGDKVFVKLTRTAEEYYWFNREVKEATIASEILSEKLLVPAPLLNEAFELSTGQHFSVWRYIKPATVADSIEVKLEHMLNAVKTISAHTDERMKHRELPLYREGWNHTVERARGRIKNGDAGELAIIIEEAVEYLQEEQRELTWIHGDLHGANIMEGTGAVVDWDGTQLSFVEWDLAHVVKEPFHHIHHDDWAEGEKNFWDLLERIKVDFPSIDLELLRQSVLLRRAGAILWKKESKTLDLSRWLRTLHWFQTVQF